jgi:membrane fusion protein (multidrug efflux system)
LLRIESAVNNMKSHRKRGLIILATFFLFIGFIYFIYWLVTGRYYVSTDDAYVSGNLIQVMPEVSGQVTSILADETNLVVKGQAIVTLNKNDADIAFKNAEAQLALTERQVGQFYQNANQLSANVQLQQDNYTKAQDDYERRKQLLVNKVISQEELDHSKIAADAASASLTLAKQQLKAAEELISNSDLYHHPEVLEAEANLRKAYLDLQRTKIYASDTGYVARRSVQVGEQVNPNTVLMIIVPLNQIWVDANFKESQLTNMRIGQPATLISDTYGDSYQYQGTVVGLNPGTGSTFDLLPPQNATGNWIKIVQRLPVRIAINPKQLKTHPLQLGLSITATVNTTNHKGRVLTTIPQSKVIYQTKNYGDDLNNADQLINQILQTNSTNLSYPLVK